jgi:hypothetical protein
MGVTVVPSDDVVAAVGGGVVGGGAIPRMVSIDAYVGAAPVPYRQPSTSPSRTLVDPPPTTAYLKLVDPAGARK